MKAIVVIDVQNDFVTGSLGSEWAQQVTPNIIKFVAEAKRDENCAIFATRDTHDNNYSNTLEGTKLPVPHCIKNTDGWQLVPGLAELIADDYIDDKTSFMSCYRADGTCEDIVDLIEDERWARRGIKRRSDKSVKLEEIIICGFVTSICVVSNALRLRGAYPNTKITVYSNLCADVTQEAHEAALTVMRSCQIDVETLN